MIQKSDTPEPRHPPPPQSEIEVIGGAFHPDRIEIQDFLAYPLTIDLRARSAYERDHIPGAVHLPLEQAFATDAPLAQDPTQRRQLSPKLEAMLKTVTRGEYVLLYDDCDRDAMVLMRELERRGFFVDVLPGGWAAYRQWVDAGLETLPRLVAWRVITSPIACEASAVLEQLERMGRQVLDLQRLAGGWFGTPLPEGRQPHQEAFDTAIVDTLRSFNGRRPVWTSFVPQEMGTLRLGTAVADAVAVSSLYRMEVPLTERLKHWRARDPEGFAAAERAASPWRENRKVGTDEAPDALVVKTLCQDLQPNLESRIEAAGVVRRKLPVLTIEAFEAKQLTAAIRRWLGKRSAGAVTD